MPTPKKITETVLSAMKQMKPIIEQQKTRDVSEADTVTLVKDVLSDAMGYDKYLDLTGEFAIRGTFCDLAVKIDGKISIIIEVKAIGISLDEKHLKQAVDYAANEGVEWVILTNSVDWQLYRVVFAKPIDKVLVHRFDVLELDYRKGDAADTLYPLTKHAFSKGIPEQMLDLQKATSRYMIAALLLNSESVLKAIRLGLKRAVNVNIDEQDLAEILKNEVIKRDALEGKEFYASASLVNKRVDRKIRKATPKPEPVAETPIVEPKIEPDLPKS